jgi:4-hydroxy-2-oxoheptanedioate aldolase
MRPSRIKHKLRHDEPALVVCLHLTDASTYELASLMGFDGIWMDLEHHATSLATAAGLMRAARVGAADIVARPARWEWMRTGRLLEAGAQAIMYPRCETAAEAADLVRWTKFAPVGQRGVDGANADCLYCSLPLEQYLRRANDETVLIAQIESPTALANVEEIAHVPGLDVLMVGPGDLSVLSGVPFSWHSPLVKDALGRVARAAAAAGIHWGTTSPDAEHSRMLLDMGARFICHGSDIRMVRDGLTAIRQEFTGLGITFDDRLGPIVAATEAHVADPVTRA